MKYALVNPRWNFDNSIYFGCREPHLPLELGYAERLLAAAGHEVLLLDGHLEGIDNAELQRRVAEFAPDFTVVPTAPSYLFWRCPPPELRIPQELVHGLGEAGGTRVLIGPHPSTTPGTTLRKVRGDIAVLGESEEVLVQLAEHPPEALNGVAFHRGDDLVIQGGRQTANLECLPALRWPERLIGAHHHHHHRFDEPPAGLGAEMEASRGCPYSCSFCAKTDHRHVFRRRPVATVMDELDHLLAQGVGYVYFIDEILMPDRDLLEALRSREIRFGVQTRIDIWKPAMLDLLGDAGCVSVEAGVESVSEGGRGALDKNCRMDTEALQERLIHARRNIPFVQASLLDSKNDDPKDVEQWRDTLLEHGVWANKPVPMFPYPGSPGYIQRWGWPDDRAWERATDDYLETFARFSDIQDPMPHPLHRLELDRGAPS